jgi:hypothetical protein
VSSIKIEPVPYAPCEGDGVYLYEHADYQGRCRRFTHSVADLTQLAWNDIASSARLVGDWTTDHEVILFEHVHFRGESRTLREDVTNLGSQNDDVSAVAIWPRPKAWTFLLYLNGDQTGPGSLSGALQNARSRMLQYGQPHPEVAVAFLADDPTSGDTWRGRIYPGMGTWTYGDTMWLWTETNLGDPQALVEFVQWGQRYYPADHYYLAIAANGNGIAGLGPDDHPVAGDYLSPAELAAALKSITNDGAAPIDVVHYDASLMAMLENAYEIRDYADYLVASQNLLVDAFAYGDYVDGVTEDTTAQDLAAKVANDYDTWSAGYIRTISAIDLNHAESVAFWLDRLAGGLMTQVSPEVLRQIRSQVQKLDANGSIDLTADDDYVDLCHLALVVHDLVPEQAIKDDAQSLFMAACTGPPGTALVAREHHTGGDYGDITVDLSNAYGVSIYWPPTSGGQDYRKYAGGELYAFTADTQWDTFIQAYAEQSGVPPRSDDDELPLVPVLTPRRIRLPLLPAGLWGAPASSPNRPAAP